MPPSTIHVEPNAEGRWIVRHEDESEPLSEHESATDAERVAVALAQHEHESFVLLRDRYARTHHLRIDDPVTTGAVEQAADSWASGHCPTARDSGAAS